MEKIQKFFNSIIEGKQIKNLVAIIKKNKAKLLSWAKKSPIKAVFAIIGILFFLIVVGEQLRLLSTRTEPVEQKPEEVSVYQIGESAKVRVIGEIVKDNVLEIRAQSGGVASQIFVSEGSEVLRGQQLMNISSNYSGESVQTLQRQIAEANHNNVVGNYDLQKQLIKDQRDVAHKVDGNSDELREIGSNSLDNLRNQLDLNNIILSNIDDTLENLNIATPSSEIDALIISNQSLKAQLLTANTQLQTNIDTISYSENNDNEPGQLSDLNKEITLKQLDLAEKGLDLQKEISWLQLKLARLNESLAYPTSFIAGVVEKVHVRPGQSIVPGQLLFTISGPDETLKIEALVSKRIAENYSYLDASRLYVDGMHLSLFPSHISSEATNGTLYTIVFTLDEEYSDLFANGQNVEISLPVGYPDTGASLPLVPIDSVTQNSDGSFIFVVDNNLAKVKRVELGELYGQSVVVNSGLDSGDKVILDRHVLENDLIKVVTGDE